jgi:hypothetical protein
VEHAGRVDYELLPVYVEDPETVDLAGDSLPAVFVPPLPVQLSK